MQQALLRRRLDYVSDRQTWHDTVGASRARQHAPEVIARVRVIFDRVHEVNRHGLQWRGLGSGPLIHVYGIALFLMRIVSGAFEWRGRREVLEFILFSLAHHHGLSKDLYRVKRIITQ